MNKKIITGVVVVVLIVIGVWYAQGNTETEVMKIGIVAPLTGGGSVYGNAYWRGAELAMQDLADENIRIEFVVEDDGTNAGQAASAAQKLINVDHVDAIMSVTSTSGNSVSPIASAAKIPHICVCADPKVGDNISNFNFITTPESEGIAWVDEAVSRGINSVAIIAQNQGGINAISDAVVKRAESKGVTITSSERFDPETRDFKTIIAKSKSTNPDTYLVMAFPPSLDVVGQQIYDLGIKNVSSIAVPAISATPELFEGVWFIDPRLNDPDFKARFEKSFPSTRFNVRTAPFGYDAAVILTSALQSKDPMAYLKAERSIDGKVGKIQKDTEDGWFKSETATWTIKNGVAVQVK